MIAVFNSKLYSTYFISNLQVFCYFALIPFGIDAFFALQQWRLTAPPPPADPTQEPTPGQTEFGY